MDYLLDTLIAAHALSQKLTLITNNTKVLVGFCIFVKYKQTLSYKRNLFIQTLANIKK